MSLVQVKVAGMDGYLGPVCPFEGKKSRPAVLMCHKHRNALQLKQTDLISADCLAVSVERARWSVLLVCLSVMGAYAVQGTLKSEYDTDHTTTTENNHKCFLSS